MSPSQSTSMVMTFTMKWFSSTVSEMQDVVQQFLSQNLL